MKQFFTADWHLGHEKSLEHDKRPFKNLGHMHHVLVNNYNSIITKDDICYFLGDIGWKPAITEVISKLNGKKILVLGNHDPSKTSLYNAGFDLLLNGAMLTLGKSIITMSHCPLRGILREDTTGMKGTIPTDNWHGESRHSQFSFPDFGQFHLHGHIHSRKDNPRSVKIQDRQYDVGVVGNNYRPVSMSTIESWIATYKGN